MAKLIPLQLLFTSISASQFPFNLTTNSHDLIFGPFNPRPVSTIPSQSSLVARFQKNELGKGLRAFTNDFTLTTRFGLDKGLRPVTNGPTLATRSGECPSDSFACHDDPSRCIPQSWVCDGFDGGCADFSNILASQCNNCTADHLFQCQMFGKSLCLNEEFNFMCDGLPQCDDLADELAPLCDNCLADNIFKCQIGDESICLTEQFKCDGILLCTDFADELLSECGKCPLWWFACKDGSRCISESWACDGYEGGCADKSNMFASQCNDCADDHLFKCQQGELSLCINEQYKCDGIVHCDNAVDELMSECGNCSSTKFVCKWGGQDVCLDKQYQCDGVVLCEGASDELLSVCGNCSDETKFTCNFLGQDTCLNKADYQCDGIAVCEGGIDERLSVCGNCTDTNTEFMCRGAWGHDICLSKAIYQCDGNAICQYAADELLSDCGNCSAETQFTCKWADFDGNEACVNKAEYQCDGTAHCSDGSDEAPSVCANCTQHGLAMCKDMSLCIDTKHRCSGSTFCNDGSDESDSWSNCTFCSQNNSVACPGFPGSCAQICDGNATCPDQWDELLSTCEAYDVSCTAEAVLYKCKDGSRCIGAGELCNIVKDCDSGEDESAENCKDQCPSLRSQYRPVHSCDDNSCIRWNQACSARNQSLCKDGSDMSPSLCTWKGEGVCYIEFPHKVDPYRWPCSDGTRCILRTSRCDGDAKSDCPDGSDENGCPWYVRLNLGYVFLICLAAVLQSFILHLLFGAWSRSLSHSNPHDLSSISEDGDLGDRILNPANSSNSTPSFLLHPALNDLEGPDWSWQDVGKELKIEVIFFNRDSQYLLSFLSKIEAQDAHPDTVHKVFQGFQCYLETEGFNEMAVAFSMMQAIGHHRLAHLALKGPPNFLDRQIYQLRKWMDHVEGKNKYWSACISTIQTLASCVTPFFLFLDYVKDPVLLLILRGTVQRLEEGCNSLSISSSDSCLAASQAEKNLLNALLIILSVSIVTTSLHAFHQRKNFFRTNSLFDFILFISSPLLPAVYHLQIVSKSRTLETEKTSMAITEYQNRKQHLTKLTEVLQQSRSIEIGLEAITQILVLCGLAAFAPFVFKAPSGQSYSYFFGVALLVLKGNAPLFFASILISFIGPCFFYVNNENHKKKESLSGSRKVVLLLRNFLFLLARVSTFISSLFLPIISQWDMFVANEGVDASSRLDHPFIQLEFSRHFSVGLEYLSDQIGRNCNAFLLFFLLHLLIVATHAILRSPKFVTCTMKERWLHLVSSFWLPLPFLTIRGVDRGEEKAELWFLITLHTCENVALLLISRWAHLPAFPDGLLVIQISLLTVNIVALISSLAKRHQFEGRTFVRSFLAVFVGFNIVAIFLPRSFTSGFELGLFVIHICIVTLNTLAVALSVLYTSKMELYANLPDSIPDLPSFGPENVPSGPQSRTEDQQDISHNVPKVAIEETSTLHTEDSEDRAKSQKDVKRVSENVSQEKEEINESGSSQSVVEEDMDIKV